MLQPYRVLDCTDHRGEIGPMLFGDLGADVVKIEPPGGSESRQQAPFVDGASEDSGSLAFLAFNRNKRSIVLDPDSGADSDDDLQALQALIRRSDFVFESGPGGLLARFGIGFDEAKALNPEVVFVVVSPFGADGPHRDLEGNDLVLAALGGPVALQGVPERAPLRLSVPQVWRHAGAEAAAAAMAAHHRRLQTGTAQFVDVSAQCAMTWTLLNAMDAYGIQGEEFARCGADYPVSHNFPLVFPCLDGYVLGLGSSAVMLACLPRMVEENIIEADALAHVDWEAYDGTMRDPSVYDFTIHDGAAILGRFFSKHTKQELLEFGLSQGVSLAPVNKLEELLSFEHMRVREYWEPLMLPDGRELNAPGVWAKSSIGGLSVQRGAPNLDQHGAEIRAELHQTPPREAASAKADALPFHGVSVTDFSWVGVGPISTKFLADHGAQVVRIESESRPDVLRGGPPFKDGEPGLDRSQFFGDFNTSKMSVSLDMKNPDAVELVKKLIVQSDVLLESFAPGAISRMGLGYEEIKQLNPGIIMVSTCLMGQTGPAAQLAGYGYHAGAIAGFYEVTGWPDLGPNGPWVAYTDTIAPRFVSLLLGAALDHRRRTGEGCHLDVAQIETALHFLAPELLELQATGYSATRLGNRSRVAAPQGCYPCDGDDRWCAIAVDTDAQWQALCREMGRTDLAEDLSLADNEGRLACHDAIDAAISEWTSTRDVFEVMHALQAVQVPAGVVQRSQDLLADPQYAHRNFYRYLEHPVMGRIPYAGHQYRISDYDHGPRSPAPMLGQHSFEVLSEVLGLDDEAIAAAYANGVVR